jgi:hypothetical protein
MKTLDETLLQNLARWRPHSPHEVLEVALPDSGWTVALVADTVDALAGKWWEARLARTGPLPERAPALSLQQRAEQIAARVTGLLEPLRLVEVDAERGTAQLRSTAPRHRGDERTYYEVLLQGDSTITVRRLSARGASPRQQVAFALTHEALAKLIADLTA